MGEVGHRITVQGHIGYQSAGLLRLRQAYFTYELEFCREFRIRGEQIAVRQQTDQSSPLQVLSNRSCHHDLKSNLHRLWQLVDEASLTRAAKPRERLRASFH